MGTMDLAHALSEGETFVKNAEEAMERKVLREDQLYVWDNQVEVLDTFLADTEELAATSPELKDLRDKLRTMKRALEKKSMEFLAQQDKTEMPEDLPPEEEAVSFVEPGEDLLKAADKALKRNITKVEDVGEWEEPLVWLNSYLADSEIFVPLNPDLAKVRAQLKDRKRELEKRVADVVQSWRAADLAGGGEEDGE
ncbi:MAG: hypothetical protein ACYDDF_02720 [Thermoplasmatota archaeon]